MQATLQFDPAHFTAEQLRIIMAKAQEWDCAPAEALGRILQECKTRFRTKAA
jgi:hypothetical protein